MTWEVIRIAPVSGKPIRWRNGPFSRERRPAVISKTLGSEAEVVYEVRLPDGQRHKCASLEDAKMFVAEHLPSLSVSRSQERRRPKI